jgi:hypothetical protein
LKSLIALLAVLPLAGCLSIKPLGSFTVEPYAKPLETKITEPLNIILLDDVKSDFTVSGAGVKPMVVSDFRTSVQGALKAVFEKNFNTVAIQQQKPTNGLALVVYRIRPYWKPTGGTSQVVGYGTNVRSVPMLFIKSAFQYESSLYYNNNKIASADGEALSEGTFSDIYQAQPVFKDGLKTLCEVLNKTILTDETIAKIK